MCRPHQQSRRVGTHRLAACKHKRRRSDDDFAASSVLGRMCHRNFERLVKKRLNYRCVKQTPAVAKREFDLVVDPRVCTAVQSDFRPALDSGPSNQYDGAQALIYHPL
jgi:hypothetical protein